MTEAYATTGLKMMNTTSNTFWNWFVSTNNIQELWQLQPTYILVQLCFFFGALMTFSHAYLSKGRWVLLWLCTVAHGIVIEILCFFLPDEVANNYWHSQTPIMFFGKRFPLHIMILYPCFYYQATVAANKFRFSMRVEPFAVALLVLLQDIPYDITCVKFVHWTWHDTDPNLFDRHYWAPWNSYFFHLSFTASFTFWFHYLRYKLCDSGDNWDKVKWKIQSFSSEFWTFIGTSLLGFVGGTVLFILIYHPLHDILEIHSEVTFFILFSMFCMIVWRALVLNGGNRKMLEFQRCDLLLLIHLVCHYLIFLLMTILGDPSKEISIGYHEQIGPCNETIEFLSALGKLLKKRKYLCIEDYDEQYFDFHCSDSLPPHYSTWYQICGTEFKNRSEYIVIVSYLTVLATFVFGHIYIRASNTKSKLQ